MGAGDPVALSARLAIDRLHETFSRAVKLLTGMNVS